MLAIKKVNKTDKPLDTSEHKIDSWQLSRINRLLQNSSFFNLLPGSTQFIPITIIAVLQAWIVFIFYHYR